MAENNSTFQNTETFLIECSRANSLVDSNDGADFNAKWLTSTNFNLRRGDQVSVEMMALNAKGAGGGNVIEFTGDNVSIDGKDKPYCDNKVLLEVFFLLFDICFVFYCFVDTFDWRVGLLFFQR